MNWTLLIAVAVVLLALFALKRASFLAADKAREYLRQGALVVDVRNPGEFNSGHVSGAINIPLGELSAEAPKSLRDKNQVLLLHCLSGARSGMARHQLKNMGYANVYNLGSYGRAETIVREAKKR